MPLIAIIYSLQKDMPMKPLTNTNWSSESYANISIYLYM